MEIMVNIKSMGKRRQSVVPVRYDLPLGDGAKSGGSFTVRELILGLTRAGVADYNQRLQQPDILKCLTKEEIQDKAESGKVSFGMIYGEKEADLQAAIDNAVQCFEDGIYRIFLGERPLEDLEERISVTGEHAFTFVRLTMLTGRMW